MGVRVRVCGHGHERVRASACERVASAWRAGQRPATEHDISTCGWLAVHGLSVASVQSLQRNKSCTSAQPCRTYLRLQRNKSCTSAQPCRTYLRRPWIACAYGFGGGR